MKLEKAIEYSEQLNPLFETWLHKDFEKAHKLGIEALKREQYERLGSPQEKVCLLPGETQD